MKKVNKIVNLTPETIRIINEHDELIEIEPSGLVVEINEHETYNNIVNGIVTLDKDISEVINLPEKIDDNTLYIVSFKVKITKKLRRDERFATPDTKIGVITKNGKIFAVKYLITYINLS